MSLLEVSMVSMTFGGLTAVRDVDLLIEEKEILGLIGPNGAGKTTLFNVITGVYRPTEGEVCYCGQDLPRLRPHEITDLGIARTFQNIRLFEEMSVLENVMIGRHCRTKAGAWGSVFKPSWVCDEEQESKEKSLELLDFVGLKADPYQKAKGLSYGQQRQLEIARALATEPTLLLLDEPAAGMNSKETEELIRLIHKVRQTGRAVLLIEHDMKVVMQTADRVAVLDHGTKIADGSPSDVQRDEKVIKSIWGTTPMLKLDDLVIRYGSIEALKGISLEIAKGEIVALIGANGAGKTTTLNAISGLLNPYRGDILLSGNSIASLPPETIVKMGISHVPEGRRVFPYMTVMENLEMGAYSRGDSKAVKKDLSDILDLFPQLTKRLKQAAGTLSGGEQQMLAMGRALMARPSLLLLDEPSMGLAPKIVQSIFKIIKDINESGTTILLVEQNAKLALTTAGRAYVLETGLVAIKGDSRDLLENESVRKAYLGE